MRAVAFLSAASAVGTALAVARSTDHSDDLYERQLLSRNIVTSGQLADSYDYVIVGGGTAGLVLANRLSEDSGTSVLVLEAGDTGEAVSNQIDIPSLTYYDSLVGSPYDWQYTTTKQPNAGDRAISWPRGKVLGGSSAINGMYLVRPSALEVNSWSSLVENGSIWNWDNLFGDMKKSETYTGPDSQVQSVVTIDVNKSSHGTDGPLHASYPALVLPAVGQWTESLNNIGIATSEDPDGGEGWGAFIATSAINPSNWTRSYSKSAYLDPLPPRSNLAVLPNATVTKLVFQNATGGLQANSVQYASAKGATPSSVNVNKEVILAAGAIGSPQILMVSGVGPGDVLQAAGVSVNVELPGVGQHLQDHIYAEVEWKANTETGLPMYNGNYSSGAPTESSPFLSFINSATGYVNFSALIDAPQTYAQQIADAVDTSAATLVPSTYPEVIEGYKAIYNLTAQKFLLSPIGHMEILLSVTANDVIGIEAALQHPFSQGRLYITSSDVFDAPVIDPQYLSHEADLTTLREGLRFCRELGNTAPLSANMGEEISPGLNVQSDEDWQNWLVDNVYTEYHPSCSCAMLPQAQGGVVGADLKVYGLTNVRVADASVFPFEFSSHLMAQTYGLAEQAAELIQGTYTDVDATTTSASASATRTSTGAKTSTTDTTSGAAAGLTGAPAWSASLGFVGVLAGAGLLL
ncbi:hypothetical protein FOMPIDRAFT_1133514 [Fomitopsis schrenkii]|uniref:Glucose-methanol-choline oxidoreductase N-terminal domain-containing protein n=1 Tax=Fomitopsis schrenkii TaxID=2126942 RepID=S8EZC3_FOMSC|nr:hypothetical protein FOMPIDRAFT_1133514 [Fomitopsis schrenkii]